jgi:L-alanine-DL-glutamate epimerase-like enolase superfamily enzyme
MTPKATITKIETIPIAVPFRVPFKIASGGARPVGENMLVRVHTDQGIAGIGETQAWRRQGSTETLASLKCAIEDHLAPRVIGRSPFELAGIMSAMDEALSPGLYAKAAIGDALYDLQGKLLDVPVWQLLGGKCRSTVGACAVLPIKDSLDETLEGADEFHRRGFRSFTVKVGVNPAAEVKLVAAVRERFPAAVIRVDANASMDFDGALALLKKLEPYDLDAAEQMVPMWDLDGMTELARRIDIPMMADECVATVYDLLEVIKRRAATVMQTKVAKNGGIWHMRNLWTLARAAEMRIYPGNHPSTSVATAAVVHLAAAWPGPLLDGPFAVGISGAFARDVVTDALVVENGAVRVPEGPGLGITLDEEAIAAMRVDR